MKIKELFDLENIFRSLPGISRKTSEKIVHFILEQNNEYLYDFINKLKSLKENINFCNICNNLTRKDVDCEICFDKNRNKEKLCIVSSFDDLNKIELTEKYNGLYFVLNFELDNKRKIDLAIERTIENLKKMINNNSFKEILIATNLTIKGEITSYFLIELISKIDKKIILTRLASGIPVNSSIDYIDSESLAFSIANRTKIIK